MTAPALAPAVSIASADLVLREDVSPVAVVTLNRPRERNALGEAMLTALADEFARIAADREVRAVVLAANGPVFCAGHDLKEVTAHRVDTDRGRAYFERLMRRCTDVMQAIVALPQPVIAAVQGTATAAGCQLVATCDLAIASEAAGFCTPGVNIGLFCSTPMIPVSRAVARKHALEMLFTGDTIPASEAFRIGLVNRVVPAGTERDTALRLARRIATKSAMTVTTGKQAFYRQVEMPLAEAYRYASQVMVDNLLTFDAQEGICAFLEKRDPAWEDR